MRMAGACGRRSGVGAGGGVAGVRAAKRMEPLAPNMRGHLRCTHARNAAPAHPAPVTQHPARAIQPPLSPHSLSRALPLSLRASAASPTSPSHARSVGVVEMEPRPPSFARAPVQRGAAPDRGPKVRSPKSEKVIASAHPSCSDARASAERMRRVHARARARMEEAGSPRSGSSPEPRPC